MDFKKEAVVFLATGCFVGKIPFAPGTLGSIAGLPFCFFLSKMNLWPAILFIAAFFAFAVWVSNRAEEILKSKDPGSIVIDEICGMMVTFAGLPFNAYIAVSGLIAFRVLDIVKPFPIRYLEKKLSGGTGIVLDDVAAGVISNLIMRAVLSVTGAG
ncbi:MAG TPA: phosphatidylglycerophosphatase A [Desulfobacterales bacterium]|nr:phosphatidylglycerophosphatase A [Desulfobacterales bacterium]